MNHVVRTHFALVLIVICVAIDISIIVWLMGEAERAGANKSMRDYLTLLRESSFVGMTTEELVKKFGEPIYVEKQDDEVHRGAIWWPSWDADAGPNKLIKFIGKDKTARMFLFENGDRNVYVWQVEDSNGVWRVLYDISPL